MVIVYALVAVCGGVSLSANWIVKEDVPLVVGVPEITPPELKVSPVGKFPDIMLQV